MAFSNVSNGNPENATDVQQIIDALQGTAGKGQPIALTALSDSVNFALVVKNNDATNSRALQVLKSDGTVVLQVDKNGIVASVDATAAAAQLVNVSLPQTLTNKTLSSPVLTSPTVNSGGLTISAGNIGISQAAVATAGITIAANAATDATNRWGLFVNKPTGATGDNLGAVIRGGVCLGDAAPATTTTTGFVYLGGMAGAPTGVPADGNSQTANMVPIVLDTTNSKIWARIGGVWKGVVLA